jgi:hypothetical protein
VKDWKKRNLDKVRRSGAASARKWAKEHPERRGEISRRSAARQRALLSDAHVMRILKAHGSAVPNSVKDAAIHVKREQLRLLRLVRDLKEGTTTKVKP